MPAINETLEAFDTIAVHNEGAVLFAEIAAPPMNLLSPELAVKKRVNAIALAPVEDFRLDSNLYFDGVRSPDAQRRIATALKHGFQTRDAEMALARLLGDLADS